MLFRCYFCRVDRSPAVILLQSEDGDRRISAAKVRRKVVIGADVTGYYSYVLFPLALIGDQPTPDRTIDLMLVEDLTRLSIEGFKGTGQFSCEHPSANGCDNAADQWLRRVILPLLGSPQESDGVGN